MATLVKAVFGHPCERKCMLKGERSSMGEHENQHPNGEAMGATTKQRTNAGLQLK